VTMGIVQDVKTQLRKSGQLKVNYSAKKTFMLIEYKGKNYVLAL